MADVVLDAMPGAAGLYAKALAPARRPDVAAGLADTTVRLAGHQCTVAEVAAYNSVCGFVLADELPATWLQVLTFPLQLTLMTASDFPLAPAGMVHVSNVMTQHRPALITEAFDLVVRAENLRAHRRGVLVDLVGEVRVRDELVWQGRSVYLNRQAKLAPNPEPGPAPKAQGDGSGTDVGASDVHLATAGLWRLPADLGRRYAAVSGDVNPIHLNPLAAKAFGFPRAIAHGMWTHARMLAALQARLPDSYEVSVEFAKPVLLPSTVSFSVAAQPDGFEASLTNRAGDKTHATLTLTT